MARVRHDSAAARKGENLANALSGDAVLLANRP
jgi:hypothetical protein